VCACVQSSLARFPIKKISFIILNITRGTNDLPDVPGLRICNNIYLNCSRRSAISDGRRIRRLTCTHARLHAHVRILQLAEELRNTYLLISCVLYYFTVYYIIMYLFLYYISFINGLNLIDYRAHALVYIYYIIIMCVWAERRASVCVRINKWQWLTESRVLSRWTSTSDGGGIRVGRPWMFPGLAPIYMYTERVIGSRAYSLCVARKHTRTPRVLYTHIYIRHTMRDVCALETQQWSLLMITKPCVTSRRMPRPCSKGCTCVCLLFFQPPRQHTGSRGRGP